MTEARLDPEGVSRRFEDSVHPAELRYIDERRRVAHGPGGAPPRGGDKLTGLALSGGGIRSATFGLGVMQALRRFRVFRHIDYLSTVSGGGYVGSALSALMANAFYKRGQQGPGSFPFSLTKGDSERPEVTHLRNNSNYMAPRGVWDLLRTFAVLLRGIILNSLCLFPFLLLVCLVVLVLYGQQLSDRARFDDQVERIDGLLARYYGDRMETDRSVDPLLQVLEAEALLREDQARSRNDVVHELRASLSFEPGERRGLLRGRPVVGDDLITGTGTGTGTGAAPFRFKPGASREDFARALLGADVLRRFEVIEETALLARAIETDGFRPCEECVGELVETLGRRSRLRDGLETRELLDFLAAQGFVEFVGEEGEEPGDEPDRYRLVASQAHLKRIVQALYNAEYLNEGTVRGRAHLEWPGREPFYAYGWYAGRVGQPFDGGWYTRYPYPRARVEGEIEQLAQHIRARGFAGCLDEEGREVLCTDTAEQLVRDHLLAGQLLRLPVQTLAGRQPGGTRPTLSEAELAAAEEVFDLLRFKELVVGKRSGPHVFRSGVDLEQVLGALYFGAYLDEGAVRRLLGSRPPPVYSLTWHRTLVGQAYPGDWCGGRTDEERLLEPGCRASGDEAWLELYRLLKDPSNWNPERISLPFTWIIVRLAFGWVLLFPLVLLAVRWVYRRRRRATARQENPLDGLLTSDESMEWRQRYDRTFGWLLVLILGTALVELLPYAVHHFHYLSAAGRSFRQLAIGGGALVVTVLGGPALAFLRRFGRRVALVLLALAGPVLLLTVFVYIMEYAVYSGPGGAVDDLLGLFANDLSLWEVDGGRRFLDSVAALALFVITALLSLGLALLVDINATSMHGIYRDRLAKAFLVGLDTRGDLEPEEDLALGQICPDGSGAPYHLINVALNLQGSGDPSLRGRKGAALCLSRDWIGGPRTGYCRTRDMEWVYPQLHLASAMAVSGAAVSPNMGRFTSGLLVVLMSLLNTRLALWIPHPGRVRRWFEGRGDGSARRSRSPVAALVDGWRRFRMRAPATLLLRELFSAIDDRGPVVNVSDGGHLENTGALELLRRRSKFILVVDGESDPEMSFEGLALLMRLARLDMGIEIDISLDDLERDDKGLSRSPWAAGTITYPGPDKPATGYLVYLKLSMTGRERLTAAEYRARNPDFPHQSTGDQSFDEDQFEAYRELGFQAASELFETLELAEQAELSSFAGFDAWFRGLCDAGDSADRSE